tara:strand:- start:855 stop:1724 length:870 start_codon:yes stop_codon:yes gene_type:complete
MNNIVLKILGTAQDGGYPHIGCKKICCKAAWNDHSKKRLIASIAIIDKKLKECWIIDSSPDIKFQINMIMDFLNLEDCPKINGIFLTHAHIGHYSGLLEFGKEAMNSFEVPIYAMPKMNDFIKSNNAFNFLIQSSNIKLNTIHHNANLKLNKNISIEPFLVSHRNEMSETVGYKIFSKKNSIVYLPDIDSWDDPYLDIIECVKNNDILILDGTFYDINELGVRNILDIPHPTIKDSINRFSMLGMSDRNKIYFTHFNHTNDVIRDSESRKVLVNEGYNITNDGDVFYIG